LARRFAGTITSGEQTHQYLEENYKGKKVMWFTRQSEIGINDEGRLAPSAESLIGDLNIEIANVKDANFLLAQGCEVIATPKGSLQTSTGADGDLSPYEATLRDASSRGLPLICANPDYIAMGPSGTKSYVAGTIARRYEELGGTVMYFGKPIVSHFEAALKALGLEKETVIHVGDSLHHDVIGAHNTGISSLFVTSHGVHAQEMGLAPGQYLESSALQHFCDSFGASPTHAMPSFAWN